MKKWPVIITLSLLPSAAWAMYVVQQYETVPIDRVVANLERQYNHPDPDEHYRANIAERLARLHAFAYAQKADSVVVNTNWNFEFYGRDEPRPFTVLATHDKTAQRDAQEHLSASILWYERALELSPTNRVAQLGHGWTLEQAGRKDDAKQAYRKTIAHEMGMPGSYDPKNYEVRSKWIAAEALDYLIPLLSPLWDWRELKTRREQRKTVATWGDAISPIVIPLEPTLSLQDILRDDESVAFNLDGTGPDQRWTWISPRAGWLVCDYDDKGLITSGRKLVGNVTFWVFWNNGFEVLAALDDNGDGVITGLELCGLKIWRDTDCDGICQQGELVTLERCGIVSLSTRCAEIVYAGRTMWESRDGVTYADGSKRDYYDVVLKRAEPELVAVH
jgi:hypothetical protein